MMNDSPRGMWSDIALAPQSGMGEWVSWCRCHVDGPGACRAYVTTAGLSPYDTLFAAYSSPGPWAQVAHPSMHDGLAIFNVDYQYVDSVIHNGCLAASNSLTFFPCCMARINAIWNVWISHYDSCKNIGNTSEDRRHATSMFMLWELCGISVLKRCQKRISNGKCILLEKIWRVCK